MHADRRPDARRLSRRCGTSLKFLAGVPQKGSLLPAAPAGCPAAAAPVAKPRTGRRRQVAKPDRPRGLPQLQAPAPVGSAVAHRLLPRRLVEGGRSASIAPKHPAALGSGQPVDADLETFLVNFVVEQTGYPTEMVELDADLEADLGIDSIKKAQLFGELGEYFDVQVDRQPDARRLPHAAPRDELPAGRSAQGKSLELRGDWHDGSSSWLDRPAARLHASATMVPAGRLHRLVTGPCGPG